MPVSLRTMPRALPVAGRPEDVLAHIGPGADVIRVAPEVVRGFEAGPDGLELLAVGGPKPEGGDGVRAESPWPED